MQLRRSFFITLLSSNLSTLVMFGVTVVLARLLTPEEIGVFSISVVFINLVAVFRDFGVGSYLVREKDLSVAQVRGALGLILTTSWVLAAGLYASAGPIADFYGQAGVAQVMHVLTFSFLLVPYAAVLSALLMRDMEAGKTAFVHSVSTVVYALTCITLALLDFGYMALAWANVANLLTNIACFWLVRPKAYVLRPSFRHWRGPLQFGSGAILGNLITTANNSAPDLVLGKAGGAHAVGLYSRANGLVGIFQQVAGPAINYNALPFIAKHHHANTDLAPLLAKSTSYLTGLAWPAYAVAAVFAHELIEVLYGARWLDAAPLVVVLCVSAAIRTGYSLCQPALLAIDRPYQAALAGGAGLVARLLLMGLLIGAGHGTQELMLFAIAISAADVLSTPVSAWLMARYFGYSIRASLTAHGASLGVGLACLVGALALKAGLPADWPSALRLSLAGISLSVVWWAALHALKHPLRHEIKHLKQRAPMTDAN